MRISLLILILFGSIRILAQDQGGIPDVEIQIVNPLKVTLPRADRNFAKVPALPFEPITPPIVYDYSLVSFSTPSYSPPVKPLRIRESETKSGPFNFISAGFGNYISPYLRGYISFFPAKSLSAGGVSFHHQSFAKGPVDDKNSASGSTTITASIKSSNNKVATEALAGFESRAAHFYGYEKGTEVDRDTTKQTYQTYFISGKISNSKKSDFNYEFSPSFSYVKDGNYAKESDMVLGLTSHYKMKDNKAIRINGSYSLTSRKDSLVEARPRHLLTVTPQFQFSPVEKLQLRAGLTVAFENDSIDDKNFHIYPAIEANYRLSKSFSAFASLSGNMEKVSLHTLSGENLWINSDISIFHTNKALDFSGGINGDLGGGFNLVAGFSFAQLRNYFLFLNDSINQAKFNTVYDDVTRTNVFAAVNFDKGNYSFRIRGDYFAYSTDVQAEAWHRPDYKLDAYVVIKAADKLSIVPRFITMGGLKALDMDTDETVSLPTALDLSLSVEYNFSEKLGAFIRFNNLLNRDYSLYNNYPVRGLQGLVGLTWKF